MSAARIITSSFDWFTGWSMSEFCDWLESWFWLNNAQLNTTLSSNSGTRLATNWLNVNNNTLVKVHSADLNSIESSFLNTL